MLMSEALPPNPIPHLVPAKITMTASATPEDSPRLRGCSYALESIKRSKVINYFTVFMASTLTCFTFRFPIT